jgi:hypothetical protein
LDWLFTGKHKSGYPNWQALATNLFNTADPIPDLPVRVRSALREFIEDREPDQDFPAYLQQKDGHAGRWRINPREFILACLRAEEELPVILEEQRQLAARIVPLIPDCELQPASEPSNPLTRPTGVFSELYTEDDVDILLDALPNDDTDAI